MKQGTLEEIILSRSVVKHIRRHNKALTIGAGVGNDYSAINLGENGLVSCEGVDSTPFLAWTKAMNNFATSGGKVLGVRILMLIPSSLEECNIKEYMACFNKLADESGIQIMGGHSEVVDSEAAVFSVSVLGICGQYKVDLKGIKPGFDIVMTKRTGIYGTDYLIDNYADKLRERFSESYIAEGVYGRDVLSIVKEAGIAASYEGTKYMHDVSRGGVYGALWQLGARINKGIMIDHFAIPIRQETVEFCEYFDLNPYMLEGTGALLIVADNGAQLIDRLYEAGIEAYIIGTVSDTNEKCVDTGTEKRFLSPVKGDEIFAMKGR